jgi:hypothetical protein
MSDLLPEWGIKLTKLHDRLVPLVQDHHAELDAMKQRMDKLERKVAQQAQLIQDQQTTLGLMQAQLLQAQYNDAGR